MAWHHYHILRNGQVPSWAWMAYTLPHAQALARAYQQGTSGRRGDTFSTMPCDEPRCPDWREWDASKPDAYPAPTADDWAELAADRFRHEPF